ncbi:MAG: hypothetical protein EOO50_09250 [Flavobacterium sp.]|uniref:S41 family peptidase n=1 Tax=Flavobacterium sp. TaxID=239 RepID=UPI001217838C|nr:S41 family peptidase [Flavobacterium sp.]RZJ66548.1 MAG: hypothetical protein EOO50_09250 [Flavobacterium sp.]
MKNVYLLLVFMMTGYVVAQPVSEIQKIEQLGLVWGLMKYKHPEVSKGKFDWDKELVALLEKSEKVNDQSEIEAEINSLFSKVNAKNPTFKISKDETLSLFSKNADFDWIDSIGFSDSVKDELHKLRRNKNIGNHYAKFYALSTIISFENEKGFKGFDRGVKSHRLLLLINFWNAIQYWDVNKYLCDENWRKSLPKMIFEFIDADTSAKFEIAKLKMTARLNDSHSYSVSNFFADSLFNRFPAFGVKIINDSLLVVQIANKELASKDGIEVGDVITKIKGLPIREYIDKTFAPLISASNQNNLDDFLGRGFIVRDNTESLDVTVYSKRLKSEKRINIGLYKTYETKNPEALYKSRTETWSMPKPDIVYINLEKITDNEIDEIFKKNKYTKGIIFDLRNYPRNLSPNKLANFLYPTRKQFVKVLSPYLENPAYGNADTDAPTSIISDPFKAGRSNSDFYKGKVIVLVNRRTMSNAEYIAMMLQQAPNATVIGEQTAGSPMNFQSYILSDKQEASFTALGGFYPDGTQVQRNGIKIDLVIVGSALNYDSDRYVSEAIKLIEK